jgi:DNA-binding response OmpR family regulator
MLLRPPDFKDDSPTLAETADIKPPPRAASQESVIAPASLNPKDFNVLVIDDDQTECDFITEALSEYNVETVHDGVAGLAKLISFKPDLVVLDVDLPIIDGFKVLAHIRSSLNMPIIIVSGSRVRASDRMLSAELGADYYLTKPYSAKELRHKARQLIARYRGISSWIVTAPRESPAGRDRPVQGAAASPTPRAPETDAHGFVSYSEFASQVENRIHIAIDKGPAFSVVGCRLSEMTANAGRTAFRLYEMIRALVRETDVVSTNPRNDMLILLVDADTAGARAFVTRLRTRVMEDMSHNLLVWVRSFPDLKEVSDTPQTEKSPADRGQFNRRASDRRNQGDDISPGIFGARKAAATGARAEYLRKEESNSEP